MNQESNKINRREFLKTVATIGATAALIPRELTELSNFKSQELKETIDDIMIEGSREFIDKTKVALDMLNGSSFEEIKKFLGRIKQSSRSGMDPDADVPTYKVGEKTWQSPASWYASTIAHDTFHSFLYYDYARTHQNERVKNNSWTGMEAEKKCLEFQHKILTELDADIRDIKHVEELMKNPTYQDIKNRDW